MGKGFFFPCEKEEKQDVINAKEKWEEGKGMHDNPEQSLLKASECLRVGEDCTCGVQGKDYCGILIRQEGKEAWFSSHVDGRRDIHDCRTVSRQPSSILMNEYRRDM